MSGLNNTQILSVYYSTLMIVVWILFFTIFVVSFMTFIFKWVGQQAEEMDLKQNPTVLKGGRRVPLRLISGGGKKIPQARHHLQVGWYVLWYGLGAIWFIDGLLQAQPDMALPLFVKLVFKPLAEAQPEWLKHVMEFGIILWNKNTVTSNIGAVLIQVGIGLAMLTGRTRIWGKIAVYTSLIWSLVIWIFGEGMGNLFSNPSFFNGTPGAALIYAVLSLFLILPKRYWLEGHIARFSLRSLSVMWIFLAIAELIPANGYYTPNGLFSIIATLSNMPQPQFISTSLESIASAIFRDPVAWNIGFSLIMLMLGVMGFFVKSRKVFLTLTMIWLAFSWWLGQDFGFFGGMGTDLNMSPLLALMYVACWWYGGARDDEHLIVRSVNKKETLHAHRG